MPHYLVKFPPQVTVGDKKEVLDEIEFHGGSFVKEERFKKAYVYDIPEDDLDLNKFRTKNYMFSLERQD